jgi:hypothetical protein
MGILCGSEHSHCSRPRIIVDSRSRDWSICYQSAEKRPETDARAHDGAADDCENSRHLCECEGEEEDTSTCTTCYLSYLWATNRSSKGIWLLDEDVAEVGGFYNDHAHAMA